MTQGLAEADVVAVGVIVAVVVVVVVVFVFVFASSLASFCSCRRKVYRPLFICSKFNFSENLTYTLKNITQLEHAIGYN